jgi:hypothetical protein
MYSDESLGMVVDKDRTPDPSEDNFRSSMTSCRANSLTACLLHSKDCFNVETSAFAEDEEDVSIWN